MNKPSNFFAAYFGSVQFGFDRAQNTTGLKLCLGEREGGGLLRQFRVGVCREGS